MLKRIGFQIEAFFHNPLRYVADKDNYINEYYVERLIETGKTAEEITRIVETDLGLLKGGGALYQVVNGGAAVLEFFNKHFLKILIAVLILVAAYYILAFRKVLS